MHGPWYMVFLAHRFRVSSPMLSVVWLLIWEKLGQEWVRNFLGRRFECWLLWLGMIFSIIAFAVLTGPPLAGALITRDGGSYLGAQLFAGSALLIGCGFLTACRYVKSEGVLMVKVWGGVWIDCMHGWVKAFFSDYGCKIVDFEDVRFISCI